MIFNLEFLFSFPNFYYLITVIFAAFALSLSAVVLRDRNRITIEVLNPDHTATIKKYKVTRDQKIRFGEDLKPIPNGKIFMRGNKRVLLMDGVTKTFIGYSENEEVSKLFSTWTMKEVHDFIVKMAALAFTKEQLIETTPLIIMFVLIGVCIVLNFLIARRIGIF